MNIYTEVFDKQVDMKRKKLIDEPVNIDLIDKNKFANNSEFVPDHVYRRLLNTISGFSWSFVPHSWKEHDDHVEFVGLLVVPGFGVHTGVGTAKKTKKDNTNALAAAKTYAFKNACKEMGLAPNVGNKTWEDDLFEDDIDANLDDNDVIDFAEEKVEEKPKKKAAPKKKKEPETKSEPEKPESLEGRIKEVREAYELEEEDDFIGFIQIWNDDIIELDDMDDEDWEDFLTHLEKNKDEFEGF